MTFSYGAVTAPAHQDSLDLLSEVADYLRRLPAHPMHSAMAKKIDAHLVDPSGRSIKDRVKLLADDQEFSARIQNGTSFIGWSALTTSGAPAITCFLNYPSLELTSPAAEDLDASVVAALISQEITAGVVIPLRPIHPILDRAWLAARQRKQDI